MARKKRSRESFLLACHQAKCAARRQHRKLCISSSITMPGSRTIRVSGASRYRKAKSDSSLPVSRTPCPARDPERISADIDPNWWQKVDYAQIAQSAKQARPQQPRQTSNPFRTGSDVSSPSRKSTGDSLQQSRRPIPPAQLPPRPTSASSQRSRASSLNDPLSAGTAGVSLPLRSLPDGNIVKRKAVPPIVPGNKPQLPARTASQSSLGVSPASPKSPSISNGSAAPAASSTLRPAGRPELNRKASTSSLLDEDDREGASQAVLRPSTRREATTEWQVIAPDPARGK
jgi:hypothetical protein